MRKIKKVWGICFILVVSLMLSGCESKFEIKSARELDKKSPPSARTNFVEIREDGFAPQKIIVNESTAVTFTNKGLSAHIIASNPHPEHTDLKDLFSPTIYPDESFSYRFVKTGTWGYHLEENPSIQGEVVVE